MKPATLVRLALAGTRTDSARVILTALSAALAVLTGLAAATVLAIPTPPFSDPENFLSNHSEQYASGLLREPGLRPGVAFALLLLTVPVLALAGQCARLGAPARDRRLAALRLAGATPGQVTLVAALETGVASLLGALVALGAYLAGREVFDRPDQRGQLALPTDVLPHPGVLAAVVLGLPLVATVATVLLLRAVVTGPLGVTRRATRSGAPRPWAGLLIGVGLLAFASIRPVLEVYARTGVEAPTWLVPTLLMTGGLLAMTGVVTGAGWFSYTAGRLLRRYSRGPAALLAAGRLTADPWAGSRTLAALLAALVFGGGAAGLRAYFVADDARLREENRLVGVDAGADPFYLASMDLVDLAVQVAVAIAAAGMLVALVEGVVGRRRAYASLAATGVPRATLSRSILWQVLAPAVPAVLLALTVGFFLARGLFGDVTRDNRVYVCDAGTQLCSDPATRERYTRTVGELVRSAPDVPVEQLGWLAAGTLVAVLAVTGLGLLLLRTSTAPEELRTP
ncbi:FtsX-like permease family protein [Micromonospora yangpuensis]|uniref:FtsX-like permease family protein n=1 Tax=Micromonospora yangpuensis TaxID=683228 RepID=A0A1C6TYQ7_9ACTN|nr:FtsX-like permease family protein [Micromonospora yangpuensis]GGM20653.1 hypothetical protein GCM10012279_43830 [Micromonospora yangpuensis]SCL46935.1 FtsX-like permease family protein [Micromonospora yangpuensis]